MAKKSGKKNRKGTKKGDKIHGKKKGKAGEAAQYVTRAQALTKLQLPLADFRRLCILKGIYPRDPKKKPAGADKTYYHTKDIKFLTHEPILNKFFELKTFMKKFKRLMGRRQNNLAKKWEERKPKFTLHHLVRERYPGFDDAVADLDDAVSMIALFQSLPADKTREIPVDAINEATRLYQEFQLYVIRSKALRKCFASIKGYYFQAEIHGHPVTWLAPHQFSQELPPEVDFRVMVTFLEFYRAMVKFVNFKLYAELGLEYPPKRDVTKDSDGVEVAALELEMREAGNASKAQAQGEEEDAELATGVAADFGEQSEEARELQRQAEAATRMKKVFQGLKVFVGREVPLRPVYFALLCGGAADVGWERGASLFRSSGAGSAFLMEDEHITHQVVDRPAEHIKQLPGREYIQPQWVFDSFNTGVLLPIAPYAPGRTPPPHLSPFVDDKAEGYVPRQREILDKLAAEVGGAASEVGNQEGAGVAAATSQPKDGIDSFTAEIKLESSGKWHSDFKVEQKQRAEEKAAKAMAEEEGDDSPAAPPSTPVGTGAATASALIVEDEEEEAVPMPTEKEEERLRRKALMPKKHKRLLQRIEKSKKKKEDEHTALHMKRRKAEKAEPEAT